MREVTFELMKPKTIVLISEGELCPWRLECCQLHQNTHQELPPARFPSTALSSYVQGKAFSHLT